MAIIPMLSSSASSTTTASHSSPNPSLNILFLCTAHNSLSQRLALVLQDQGHHVTVELAISAKVMIEATTLASPDLIICPFLVKKVPAEIFERYLTLIVHPGPPGDAGPSAIDWALLGDDGREADSQKALEKITSNEYVANGHGRTHWGLTVLQAIEEFDAGPIWAWDQFPLQLDGSVTKASLYRGPVTQAAVTCCLKAIQRILSVATAPSFPHIHPSLPISHPSWSTHSVSTHQTFLGGRTLTRPLLKPVQRAWDPARASALVVSRALRASDSQPGVQSSILAGTSLYLYGGAIEDHPIPFHAPPGTILAQRHQAILISTADGKAVWVTHIRRLKPKNQTLLPPKLPAVLALRSLPSAAPLLEVLPVWELEPTFSKAPQNTFQEVWIDYDHLADGALKVAYVYSDFYNGAASTSQCQRLLLAIREAASTPNLSALVLMGGSYWNNGIHLGVCSTEVGPESWNNINAINDCVRAILEMRGIVTFAGIRGNAAAGGFALATCCDYVFCVENAVINPHYRAVGLYGSEYHSLTWYARAGEENTKEFMTGMLPMSALGAKNLGLVDRVIPMSGSDHQSGVAAIGQIKAAVAFTLLTSVDHVQLEGAPWTKQVSSTKEATPEHRRIVDSVPLRKAGWFERLPQPLSAYRKQELDFMKFNFTDPRYARAVERFTGKAAATQTPMRFALHRRYGHWHKVLKDEEEEKNYFNYDDVDVERVHFELKIDNVEPIRLVLPPSLAWIAPSSTTQVTGSMSDFSPQLMSRSHSQATTLFNPLSPRTDRVLKSPALTNVQEPTVNNRRLSRVVNKLKSAFVIKPDELTTPANGEDQHAKERGARTSMVGSVSKPKHRVHHQMACYYQPLESNEGT